MKKNFKYIFVFFICFMFINEVYAVQHISCKYTKTSTNDWDISFNKTLELELELEDNKAKINKLVVYTSPQDVNDCKNKVLVQDESFANEFCSSGVDDYSSSEVKIDFSISEGDGCPKNLDIYVGSPLKIYIPTGTSSYNNTSEIINDTKTYCGNITEIPKKIPELTSFAVTLIQVAVPVVLIILGSIDLFKGITANKDDEMKKGQQMFIKRLIAGALVFFIVIMVKFIMGIVAEATTADIIDCIDCFIDYKSCGR